MNPATGPLLVGLCTLAVACGDPRLQAEGLSIASESSAQHKWEFPASLLPSRGIPEPPVTVYIADFNHRRFSESQEREIATALARTELVLFVHSIGDFSRGSFYVAGDSSGAPIAYAQEERPIRDPHYRTWMVVHDGRHLQVTAVPRGAGWRITEVLPTEARTLQACTHCLPDTHRSGDAVGPPFLIDRAWVRWSETYFDGIPFSSFIALFRTGNGRLDDDFQIVDEPDGTQTLRATFATRTRKVPLPTATLRTDERPDCSIEVEHRTRWLIRQSGRLPQIEIDSVMPGALSCCGLQVFGRPQPQPLCVEAPLTYPALGPIISSGS